MIIKPKKIINPLGTIGMIRTKRQKRIIKPLGTIGMIRPIIKPLGIIGMIRQKRIIKPLGIIGMIRQKRIINPIGKIRPIIKLLGITIRKDLKDLKDIALKIGIIKEETKEMIITEEKEMIKTNLLVEEDLILNQQTSSHLSLIISKYQEQNPYGSNTKI